MPVSTPSLLITNNHVLRSENDAERTVAEFNYQLTDSGDPLPVERFHLKPDVFFLTHGDLDFALVAVELQSANGTALTSFGYCPLLAAEGKSIVRDPVNIVQHPKGELKQIAIRNNPLLDLPEDPGLDKLAHYETDTEQGSSGSPVFNDQWEVIALHHSGVPRTNAAKQILDRDGNVWPENGDPDKIDWIANEGIRTSRLVTFIKNSQVRDHEKALHAAISSGANPAQTHGRARLAKIRVEEFLVSHCSAMQRTEVS
jgi:endonuclease G, mitochondrial